MCACMCVCVWDTYILDSVPVRLLWCPKKSSCLLQITHIIECAWYKYIYCPCREYSHKKTHRNELLLRSQKHLRFGLLLAHGSYSEMGYGFFVMKESHKIGTQKVCMYVDGFCVFLKLRALVFFGMWQGECGLVKQNTIRRVRNLVGKS